MTLTDDDILELNDLCNALVDGTITERQQAQLSQWLASSGEARELYVRTMGLSASLHLHAAEMQTGEPEPHPAEPSRTAHPWRIAGLLAAAACIGVVTWMVWFRGNGA